ncbi:MAG: hypothetical protein NTW96_01860 [Planctomycetia bacterium]|nr:hypothetical protein [Planctomycetia bacterium]
MSFPEIAHTARLLHSTYPTAAADLRRAEQVLKDTRTDGPAEHVPAASHTYRSIRDEVCEPLGRKLAELASVVPVLLPGTWKTLRLVGGVQHWHRERIFDWEAGIAELRAIESAALSVGGAMVAAEAKQDGDEGTVTGRREGSPAKKATVNARMMDLISKLPECHAWSVRQFANRLECSKSTVSEQPAWSTLKVYREMARQKRAEVKQTKWQNRSPKTGQ